MSPWNEHHHCSWRDVAFSRVLCTHNKIVLVAVTWMARLMANMKIIPHNFHYFHSNPNTILNSNPDPKGNPDPKPNPNLKSNTNPDPKFEIGVSCVDILPISLVKKKRGKISTRQNAKIRRLSLKKEGPDCQCNVIDTDDDTKSYYFNTITTVA